MNFTHLFAFLEVARAGSISAGAERLRVSQPAVTREIRELEDRLGLVLFFLTGCFAVSGITDAGTMLLRYSMRRSPDAEPQPKIDNRRAWQGKSRKTGDARHFPQRPR